MNGIQGSVDDNNRNRGINDMFGGSRGLDHRSTQSTTSTYLALSISSIGHYTSSIASILHASLITSRVSSVLTLKRRR
ncbi:Highly reducing polyketide synthase gloL [Fusarium oxysporum f. sp. albedinis]|nr:Highly reducing polyketide synthase gloL [Fusarium oxysporum f. sp. albedinis]